MDKKDLIVKIVGIFGTILYYPIKTVKRQLFSIEKNKKILVNACFHGLGNIILLTPFLNTLKQNLRNTHISILVGSKIAEELLRCSDCVDEVILFEGASGARIRDGIKFFRREIAPRRFDLVISTFLEVHFKISLWNFFGRIPYRLGFNSHLDGFLDTIILSDQDIHEVERHMNVIKHLGLKSLNDDIRIHISDKEKNFTINFLKNNGVDSNELILGIHPGSDKSIPEKRWNIEKFLEVADNFKKKYKCQVIFFGGPDDREILKRIPPNKYVLVDKFPIKQVAALISKCALFLSNDSGLMHLASAFKIPTVAIFGPTITSKNYPWKTKHYIITKGLPCSPCYHYWTTRSIKMQCKENIKCLGLISPEEVLAALEKFLPGGLKESSN